MIITWGFTQNEQFQIIENLKDKNTISLIEVYKINKIVVDASKFELVEAENPLYTKKQAEIDSLKQFNSELTQKVSISEQENTYLQNAVAKMNSYLNNGNPETSKYGILEDTQKELDKTSHKIDFYRSKKDFYAACDGRLMDAMNGKNYYKIEKYIQKTISEVNELIKAGNSIKNKLNYNAVLIAKLEKELITLPKTAKINKATNTVKREILLVDTVNINENISGRFIKKDGPVDENGQSRYAIMLKNYQHFVKNELILKDSVEVFTKATRDLFKGVGGNTSYLIENVKTNELYYTTGDILNNIAINSQLAEIYENIDALKIQKTVKDDKIILTYNGYTCVLTPDLYDRLSKKDASVIEAMHKSVAKRKILMENATKSADLLRKYISAYKARTITTEGLNEWKKETKNCDQILSQMQSLPFANTYYYSEQFDREETKLHIAIMDYVSYSKEKLGL